MMNDKRLNFGMRPPAQAPPQRGFCPGGRALWLGEIADCGINTPNSELPGHALLSRTGRTPNCKGISLIEVIMVMVIVAILAAVVIPRAGFDVSPRASVEGAAYMIASDIRYAQECAMATRTSKTITFSLGANSYSFALTPNNLDPTGQLPPGVTTTALTLTFNSLGEPIVGGGGSVTLSGGGGTKTINVENYTGKVSISL